MARREKIRELAESVLIVILLVALVCLCAIYLFSYQGTSSPAFTRERFETIDSEAVRYRYQSYLSADYAAPRFIGLAAPSLGSPRGFLRGTEEMREIYAQLTPFLEKLFGEQGKSEVLSPADGEKALAAALAGNYIYLSYLCDLPKSLLLTLTGEETVPGDKPDEYICEIFILPDEEVLSGVVMMNGGTLTYQHVFTFHALARDAAGNYYRYTTSYVPATLDDIGFHTNYYVAYNTLAAASSYRFACQALTDGFFRAYDFAGKIADTTVLFDGDLFGDSLLLRQTARPADGDEKLLQTLAMNPQKVSFYTDDVGNRYYFDEGESLKITAGGGLEYTASDASGRALSSVFGLTGGAREYTAADYLGAALVVLNTLDTVQTVRQTADLRVVLTGVTYESETLTFSFGYTYRNLPVFADGTLDRVRITMSGGKIQAISCDGLLFEVGEGFWRMPNMTLALRAYIMNHDAPCEAFPAYLFPAGVTESNVEIAARTKGGAK